jgi:hypothetical protein
MYTTKDIWKTLTVINGSLPSEKLNMKTPWKKKKNPKIEKQKAFEPKNTHTPI